MLHVTKWHKIPARARWWHPCCNQIVTFRALQRKCYKQGKTWGPESKIFVFSVCSFQLLVTCSNNLFFLRWLSASNLSSDSRISSISSLTSCTESISCFIAIMSLFTSHTSLWQDSTLRNKISVKCNKSIMKMTAGVVWSYNHLCVKWCNWPLISERATCVSSCWIPWSSCSFPVRFRFIIFICFCSLTIMS